jgi:hypothetical protein
MWSCKTVGTTYPSLATKISVEIKYLFQGAGWLSLRGCLKWHDEDIYCRHLLLRGELVPKHRKAM